MAGSSDEEKLLANKHKDLTEIELLSPLSAVNTKHTHHTQLATKKSHREKKRFAKFLDEEELRRPNDYELEAAVADLYRYLLGPDRAPKNRVIPQFGILSTEVPGFRSLKEVADIRSVKDYLKEENLNKISVDALIEGGMGSLLAANYLMQENDCHWGNSGFNENGKLSRIDLGQSLAPITFGEDNTYYFSKADSDYDLQHLTHPRDFTPVHHPLLINRMEKGKENEEYNLLHTHFGKQLVKAEDENPLFQIDKWKTILKAGLLSVDMIKKMLYAHCSSQENADAVAEKLYQRFQTIKNTLIALPEFQEIFDKYGPQICAVIQEEVDEYNKEFSKKHPERQIPLDQNALASHYGNHFSKTERDALIQRLEVMADEIIERSQSLSSPSNKQENLLQALKERGQALLEESQALLEKLHDKSSIKRMHDVIDKTCVGLASCIDDVQCGIEAIEHNLTLLPDKIATLSKREKELEVTLHFSKKELENLNNLIHAKRLRHLKTEKNETAMQAYLSPFYQKQKKLQETQRKLEEEIKKTRAEQSKSEKLFEIQKKGHTLLKKEKAQLTQLNESFSKMKADSARKKLNRLRSSNTLPDADLKTRIDQLISKLDTYTQETGSLVKVMIREQMDPDFIKDYQEDVELSQRLKKSLIRTALTEEGFKKHLDTFIQSTHGTTLRNLLTDAKRPPNKAAP